VNKKVSNNYRSNISLFNGVYQIDTNAIIRNNNLEGLITDLEKADLTEIKTIAEIPSFIKTFLDGLTNGFSITNSGEDWQVGCTSLTTVDENGNVINEKKPKRQLIYFGLGQELALMTYYKGGFGKSEHIVIIKFDNTKIVDFWCGNILRDTNNKTKILKYLKATKDKEWGLNTNIIIL